MGFHVVGYPPTISLALYLVIDGNLYFLMPPFFVVWIWNRQGQIRFHHEGVLPTGIWSLKPLLHEASDQDLIF